MAYVRDDVQWKRLQALEQKLNIVQVQLKKAATWPNPPDYEELKQHEQDLKAQIEHIRQTSPFCSR